VQGRPQARAPQKQEGRRQVQGALRINSSRKGRAAEEGRRVRERVSVGAGNSSASYYPVAQLPRGAGWALPCLAARPSSGEVASQSTPAVYFLPCSLRRPPVGRPLRFTEKLQQG